MDTTVNTFSNPRAMMEDFNFTLNKAPSLPFDDFPVIEKVMKPAPVIKPLASMMVDRFRGKNIKELFPEFEENRPLRFLKLFPGKEVYKYNPWKNIRQYAKRKGDARTHARVPRPYTYENSFASLPDPDTDPDAYCEDQAIRFHSWKQILPRDPNGDLDYEARRALQLRKPEWTDWRQGPAEYWYDMLNLPEKVEDYDYDLKQAIDNIPSANEMEDSSKNVPANADKKQDSTMEIDFPEDAFLMVSQYNWENDVIWDADDIKEEVTKNMSKPNNSGWMITDTNVFNSGEPGFLNNAVGSSSLNGVKLQTPYDQVVDTNGNAYSIFSTENEELVYGRWEDEVIWDHENMPIKLHPKIVSMDPNDENIVFGIPEDIEPNPAALDDAEEKMKSKPLSRKHGKKSKMLLNRSGIINIIEDDYSSPVSKQINKDPWNLSNDEFYAPRTFESLKSAPTGENLPHATTALELQPPFIPTHMGPSKLRQFHRLPIKRWKNGPLSDFTKFYGIFSLQDHMDKTNKYREAEKDKAGGGEVFYMREPEDITGKDGEIILFEYMEEHPPLLNFPGMCSKIKNYYKKHLVHETVPKNYKYGETTVARTSPFLGNIPTGQTIQAFENSMYRAPIYEHRISLTDFLIIRTKNEYSVRECDSLFAVGQECPLFEVPGPSSKKANIFIKDVLQVFIYRLFWESTDNPRRVKMDDIKDAFPTYSESAIRKRLKPCAEFHRTTSHYGSSWWVIKPHFRLPTEDEIRSMVTPEQCCAYFSMIAAEQRLKDAGYGEKSLIALQEDEDDDSTAKLDDEAKVAPWNTTRAYMLARKGKCLLQLTGLGDPTGPAGEGFSYVRIPNKPTNKEEQEQQPKKNVTGTDADLRKLPLKEGREILRKSGVAEEEIMRLTRWEVVDVVRTLSTEKVKAGDEDGEHKFSRGNRFSIAEHQERYREECQRIFDVQNKVLSSSEVLSSDEAESSEEENNEEELDEMGKRIESSLLNNKSSGQIRLECEEKERENLLKDITSSQNKNQSGDGILKDINGSSGDEVRNKYLQITRTYNNPDGTTYTKTEIVRTPVIVEHYVRIRNTKDRAYIQKLAAMDPETKEELKKEKRRLQEQIRRLTRNEESNKVPLKRGRKRKYPEITDARNFMHPNYSQNNGINGEIRSGNMSLNDNDGQVGLTYILNSILKEKICTLQESWCYMKPVNKKQMPHFYDMISEPMDLGKISKRVSRNSYSSRELFLHDFNLMHENSIQFNGPDSEYTAKAEKMLNIVKEELVSFSEPLDLLEEKIREEQKRAIENQRQSNVSTVPLISPMGFPIKRGRGRPRKYPINSEGQAIYSIPGKIARGSNGLNGVALEKDLQFSDSDFSSEEDNDDEPNENSNQNGKENVGYNTTWKVPEKIGNFSMQPKSNGKDYEKVPENIDSVPNDRSALTTGLQMPKEQNALGEGTFHNIKDQPLSGTLQDHTLGDQLEISDDSSDEDSPYEGKMGGETEFAAPLPINRENSGFVAPFPISGANTGGATSLPIKQGDNSFATPLRIPVSTSMPKNQMPPPGAMSARVQEDDEIWF